MSSIIFGGQTRAAPRQNRVKENVQTSMRQNSARNNSSDIFNTAKAAPHSSRRSNRSNASSIVFGNEENHQQFAPRRQQQQVGSKQASHAAANQYARHQAAVSSRQNQSSDIFNRNAEVAPRRTNHRRSNRSTASSIQFGNEGDDKRFASALTTKQQVAPAIPSQHQFPGQRQQQPNPVSAQERNRAARLARSNQSSDIFHTRAQQPAQNRQNRQNRSSTRRIQNAGGRSNMGSILFGS